MPRIALVFLAVCSMATADVDPATTPYSCDGVDVAAQTATADPSVAAPWRALADDTVTDPTGWIATVGRTAQDPAPAGLGTEDRVRLQHQLLRVAARLDTYARYVPETPHAADTRRAVMAIVRAVAPTARELDQLGDAAHPEVAAVLGSDVVERATSSCVAGSLIHVSYFGGLLAFRPLRSGSTRALVAQLVAFDSAGAPHITPLVDDIEMRRGGTACVVATDDAGRLATVPRADLEQTKFVARRGDGVGCAQCHSRSDAFEPRDITDPSALADIDRARFGQVERLAAGTFARYRE